MRYSAPLVGPVSTSASLSTSPMSNSARLRSPLVAGREMDILANSIVEYLGVTEEEAGGMLESRLQSV